MYAHHAFPQCIIVTFGQVQRNAEFRINQRSMTNIRYLLGVSDRDLRALGLNPEKRESGRSRLVSEM